MATGDHTMEGAPRTRRALLTAGLGALNGTVGSDTKVSWFILDRWV